MPDEAEGADPGSKPAGDDQAEPASPEKKSKKEKKEKKSKEKSPDKDEGEKEKKEKKKKSKEKKSKNDDEKESARSPKPDEGETKPGEEAPATAPDGVQQVEAEAKATEGEVDAEQNNPTAGDEGKGEGEAAVGDGEEASGSKEPGPETNAPDGEQDEKPAGEDGEPATGEQGAAKTAPDEQAESSALAAPAEPTVTKIENDDEKEMVVNVSLPGEGEDGGIINQQTTFNASNKSLDLAQQQNQVQNIISTLQDAIQQLTEGTHLVDNQEQRNQLLVKQQQLRNHCVELQMVLRNSMAEGGEQQLQGGPTPDEEQTNLIHPASEEQMLGADPELSELPPLSLQEPQMPSEAYGNVDLREIVAGLEDLGSQSPLLRSLIAQNAASQNPSKNTAVPGDFVGTTAGAHNDDFDDRPMSVASSEFEREVDRVRQIRRKIDLAKEGKNVTEFDKEEDGVWYEIDEAEKDVVDLRRMRRQIRCLFGTQTRPEVSRMFDSPTTSTGSGDRNAAIRQSLFDEFGRSPVVNQSNAVGSSSSHHNPSFLRQPNNNYPISPKLGQLTRNSDAREKEKEMQSILKNIPNNPDWAQEVVKAATAPGNQWHLLGNANPPPPIGSGGVGGGAGPSGYTKSSYPSNAGYQQQSRNHAWIEDAERKLHSKLLPSKQEQIMSLGSNRQYIGELSVDNKPEGRGVLVLADGSQHVGEFRAGRANGSGIFLSTKGSVLVGEWAENRRVGEFLILDHTGICYKEKYELGERTSRDRITPENAPPAKQQSTLCIRCQSRFYPEFNHPWACRTLRGSGSDGAGEGEFKFAEHVAFTACS
ncbi:unnamed protein product [Amoebophrya sp. A120]|nr:unnamed protein product [Amoebophrya sp. A120]|eukprot:GSA120T00020710001.1